jgi:hypothetical protein
MIGVPVHVVVTPADSMLLLSATYPFPSSMRQLDLERVSDRVRAALARKPIVLPDALTHVSIHEMQTDQVFDSLLPCFQLPSNARLHMRTDGRGVANLPAHTESLTITGYDFSLRDVAFPASLTELRLPHSLDVGEWPLRFPPNLRTLACRNKAPWREWQLPDSLTHIDTYRRSWREGERADEDDEDDEDDPPARPLLDLTSFRLPPNLTTIDWDDFNAPLDKWQPPPALRTLYLRNFRRPAALLRLPMTGCLTELNLRRFTGAFDELQFPASLQCLTISGHCTVSATDPISASSSSSSSSVADSLVGKRPPQLHRLHLVDCGPSLPLLQPWTASASLTHLQLSGKNIPLHALELPPTLLRLELNGTCAQSLETVQLPPVLTHLLLTVLVIQGPFHLQLPGSLQELALPSNASDEPTDFSSLVLPPRLRWLWAPRWDIMVPRPEPRHPGEHGRELVATALAAWARVTWPAGLPEGCELRLGQPPSCL